MAAAVAGLMVSSFPSVANAAPEAAVSPDSVVGLAVGSSGPSVTALQKALLAQAIEVRGGADGQFGPGTRAAVTAFQKQHGLSPTGRVDRATAEALGLVDAPSVSGLSAGASGGAVRVLQERLINAGAYLAGGVDGQFGPATSKAVADFQRWNGLNVSGAVDQRTAALLESVGAQPKLAAAAAPAGGITTPTSVDPYQDLAVGSTGSKVKAVQQRLLANGVNVRGGADGIFGPATRDAIKAFQAVHGASQTGRLSADDVARLGLGGTPAPASSAPAAAPVAPAASSGDDSDYVGLAAGARGDAVKKVQQALVDLGFVLPGGADGIFGNGTKSTLQAFQRVNGLEQTGVVGRREAEILELSPASPTATAPAATPAGIASNNPYAGLKAGSKGSEVRELQQALLDLGFTVRGGADGQFGPATADALKAFQGANGLDASGVLSAAGAKILLLGDAGVGVTPTGYPALGEVSDRVRQLQTLLIAASIAVSGGADGAFGPATKAALEDYQRRNGLAVNGVVDKPTANHLSFDPADASPTPQIDIEMRYFPVQGTCYYGNSWHAPRGGGRRHVGVDILGAEGLLLYAVVDGTIEKRFYEGVDQLAGNGLRLTEPNGTYYTYLHLLDVAPGIKVGTKVKAGDVIGFLGNTGSSATPHLHFEIHPGGGAAINPYPLVKAIDNCKDTTARYQTSYAPAG